MSAVVFANKSIPFSTPLSVVMVANSYTFTQLNTNLSDITASIVDEPIPLTGKSITQVSTNLKYDASDLVYITPSGVNVGGLYIYQTSTGKLLYYLTSDEIEPQGANLGFVFDANGIAQILNVIARSLYIQQKFDATGGTDFAPTVTTEIIEELPNGLLFAIPFTKGDTGFIRALSPSGVIYDAFKTRITADGGTDYATAITQQAIDDSDFDTTLFMIPFTSGGTGKIYGVSVNPTVYPVTAQYDFTTIGLPDLIVTRVSPTEITIDCANLPSGYGIRLFRANSYSGSSGKLDTNLGDLQAVDLPYTDSGLSANNAYKYAAYFITTGEINATPITSKGGISQARYTTVNSRVL